MRLAAHAAATARPAAVDPVNDTLSTPGWRTRCSPTAPSPGSTLTTPGGSSASLDASRPKAVHPAAIRAAGLSTTAQPASSAGTSLVTMRNCGMFHGTIAATTPTGSLPDVHVGAEETRSGSRCHACVSARSQNARIIIAGRPPGRAGRR